MTELLSLLLEGSVIGAMLLFQNWFMTKSNADYISSLQSDHRLEMAGLQESHKETVTAIQSMFTTSVTTLSESNDKHMQQMVEVMQSSQGDMLNLLGAFEKVLVKDTE